MIEVSPMVANIETEIWDRAFDPPWRDLDPQVAQGILAIRFKPGEIDRMNELAELAREGKLTAEQRAEIEAYNRVGHLLALLQAQARRALQQPARE
jgi:hypothetical protein